MLADSSGELAKLEEIRLFAVMAPLSLYVIERFRLVERWDGKWQRFRRKLTVLYGERRVELHLRLLLARMLSGLMLSLLGCAVLIAVSGGDTAVIVFGIAICCAVPALCAKELDARIRRKKRTILMELPEFLNKITLLVNAGETVQKAIVRSAESKRHLDRHPFYAELNRMAAELDRGSSFSASMEAFSKRCGVQEVSLWASTVLINYRRGGEQFVSALQDLSRQLWEKRKASARTLGEEASSKMVFPMMLTFLVLMVIVAAPAVMLMQ